MDEGGFIVDYWTPAGSDLAETNRVIEHIESMIQAIPEVEGSSRRTGLELGLATVTEANRGDIAVKLKQNRNRSTEEVIDQLRAEIAREEPRVNVEFVEVLQDMIGDLSNEPEDVFIKLFNDDPAKLQEWAPKVADAIAKVPGVVDLKNGIADTISGPATVFTVDPMVAMRAGFTPEEVSVDASAVLEGEPSPNPVVAKDRAYTIRVRFPDQDRISLDAMKNTMLASGAGHTATLGSLATIQQLPGQTEIRRENMQRLVTVTARLEGTDLGSAMAAVRKTVAAMNLPSDIRIVYGGQYEQQQQSFHDLLLVLALAIVLVFIVLLFEFRHVRGAGRDSVLRAAFDMRSVRRAADHGNDVQHLVVHGADHGDRHRGEERHPAAGCRPEIPERGEGSARGDGPRRQAQVSADPDDGAGDGCRDVAACARARAPARRCCNRWPSR